MVEIYGSWSQGIIDDKKALTLIKDSNLLAGIETSGAEDAKKILDFGLKYSLHNPLFEKKTGLDSPIFKNEFISKSEVYNACLNASPPVVSFHAASSCIHKKDSSKESIIRNVISNSRFLDETINKKIIFELPPYHEAFFECGNKTAMQYALGEEFLKEVFAKTNTGYLFDISHALVSASAKIRLKEFKREVEDYFAQMLQIAARETYEIHINCPIGNMKEGFIDAHKKLSLRDKNSKLILSLAKEVVDSCPNLKLINIEINSGLTPQKHAKLLIEQAKLIEKELF